MISLVFFWSMLLTFSIFQNDFLADQKRYPRVRTAFAEKEDIVTQKLAAYDIAPEAMHLLITAYKEESELEIYAKGSADAKYKKIASYAICSKSGQLGPKRKQGDYQVPEGFYHIDRFNPVSNFHLSLGINYPNQADRKKSMFRDPGGDIFIHGDCVTVGCLPMTDDSIKEIYLFAIFAKASGQQKIPVYIFPYKMGADNFRNFEAQYHSQPSLIAFWATLKTGYDQFESRKEALRITLDAEGNYRF